VKCSIPRLTGGCIAFFNHLHLAAETLASYPTLSQIIFNLKNECGDLKSHELACHLPKNNLGLNQIWSYQTGGEQPVWKWLKNVNFSFEKVEIFNKTFEIIVQGKLVFPLPAWAAKTITQIVTAKFGLEPSYILISRYAPNRRAGFG